MKKESWIILLFTFVLGFLSRLIFVDSNVFFFDSDEAIVGLMGMDFLKGNFPLYFYGQTYGLAFFEALLVSGGIALFGNTMLAIKIPMLLLWLGGVYFLGLTIHHLNGKRLWVTLVFLGLLLLSPTWLVWSMKARGGYLTSFFLSSLLIWLMVTGRDRINLLGWFGTGIGLAIIFESQPLWLLPTLLIVIFSMVIRYWGPKKDFRPVALMGIGFGLVYGVLSWMKSGLESIWNPPSPDVVGRLSKLDALPEMMTHNLEGNYFLGVSYTTDARIYGILFLLVWILSCVVNIRSFLKDKRSEDGKWTLVLTTCSFLALAGFFLKDEYRYLLPFSGFAILVMVMAFQHAGDLLKRIFPYLLSAIILMGLLRLPGFMDYSFVNMNMTKVDRKVVNDQKAMEDLIEVLQKNDIQYVYTVNASLYYQLNFLTNYEILTITRKDRCRVNWMLDEVYEAYPSEREKFAMIGYNFHFQQTGKVPLVKNKIYYILNPEPSLMKQVGFFKRNEEKAPVAPAL